MYTKIMTGWKSIQTKKKVKEKTKLGLLVLGLIILSLLFAQIFSFTKTLFSPWKQQQAQKRNYTWDSQFNINLLFRSKRVSFISYNPTEQKISIVDIPDETYLEVSHGFGNWQLGSVFELGGDKLLKDTLIALLGQPIDGFLDFSGKFKNKSAAEIIDQIRRNPVGSINILPNLKTDLTLLELIRLNFAFSSVRFDKITQINLLEAGSLTEGHLLDGTPVLIPDLDKIDTALINLADPKIKNDHKFITIFNGTNTPLFAQKWARLITNMGGNVITTTNAGVKIDKTIVVGETSDTLKRLQQVFNFKCKIEDCLKIQKTDEDLSKSRGQINVKLSSDLLN